MLYITNKKVTVGFLSTHTHTPPTLRRHTTTRVKETNTTTHKWASFTYTGKEPVFITNLFKKTDLKIAWRTTNTIQRLLMPQHQPSDRYARSGTCKLTFPDCNKAYVGQTVCRTAFRPTSSHRKHVHTPHHHIDFYIFNKF